MSRPIIARGNSDFFLGKAQLKRAKPLPLAFGEVAEFGRPLSWFIREALSLFAVVVAAVTFIVLAIGGVNP